MAKNEYLKQVIDGVKFRYKIKTQKEIVERLGYTSPTNLSDMLNGKTEVSEIYSERFRDVFSVNPEFLMTGQGPIWIDESYSARQSGDNNTQVIGDGNHINNPTTLDKAIDEIAAQRKLVEKSQEQIDRLLSIIEQMNK